MAYIKHILLGRITKIYGFGGAVIVKTEKIFSENIPEMESIFLEIEGRPVPFFIEYTEQASPGLLRMKFEGYDNAAKVKDFVNCNVFLTGDRIPGIIKDDLHTLQGYTMISDDNRTIGVIKEILHNPGQILLVVRSETGKEILIPLHEDMIQELKPDQKILTMNLPEGLTEIN
jgi:16S rRNA processing protein RimM